MPPAPQRLAESSPGPVPQVWHVCIGSCCRDLPLCRLPGGHFPELWRSIPRVNEEELSDCRRAMYDELSPSWPVCRNIRPPSG